MIDWLAVLINSLWILGLSILLASFSYQYWLAGQVKRPLRAQLNTPSFLQSFWLSLGLISAGLAGSSQTWWETSLWTLFTLLSLYNLFTANRQP